MFLENNRSRIEKQFETFCQKLPGIAAHINKRMDALNPDVILALKYLYVCMPYSDAGNYSFDTFLDFAWQGIYLWKNSPYRSPAFRRAVSELCSFSQGQRGRDQALPYPFLGKDQKTDPGSFHERGYP